MTETSHTVLVFIMGHTARPQRMTIAREGLDTYRLMPINSVFSPEMLVYCMHFRVGASRFVLYFDKHKHEVDRENAVYMFVGVASSGRPIDVCPEDDMAAMTEVLTQCVSPVSCHLPYVAHDESRLASTMFD